MRMQVKPVNDIAFHYGPRKCGKSLFVERELRPYAMKTYIGTLSKDSKYIQTINEHQQRRTDTWTTFEITEDFESDLQHIRTHLNNKEKEAACMVDGLITWFEFLKKTSVQTITWHHFTNGLIQLIDNSNITWRLVDVDPGIFKESTPCWTDYKKIHQKLISKLEIKKIIDWRYEQIQNTLD